MRELKNKKDNNAGSVALASYTHARIEKSKNSQDVELVILSLLTRVYELKEPVRNPLILNASRPSFREPITFILYISVFE